AQETNRGSALIEVDEELDAECFPEAGERDVRGDGFELDVGIKIEDLAAGLKGVERVTVDVVAVRGVVGPVGVGVVRGGDADAAAGLCYAVKFGDERHNVGDVFDDVAGDYEVEFVIGERVRDVAEVVDDIGGGAGVIVEADRPF